VPGGRWDLQSGAVDQARRRSGSTATPAQSGAAFSPPMAA
jgi:hypothetical protein